MQKINLYFFSMVCQIIRKSSTGLDELFVSLPSEPVSALILSLWFIISLKLTAINWMTKLRNCWSPTLTDMNPKSYLNSLCALAKKRAGISEDNTCNLFAWGRLGGFCKFVTKYVVITVKFDCYNFIIAYTFVMKIVEQWNVHFAAARPNILHFWMVSK